MEIARGKPGSSRVKERITELFEMPRDSMLDVPRIVVVGNRELSIENHLGVIEYTSSSVAIATARGKVTIRGRELAISSITKTLIGVRGVIESLDLPLEPS